ncbi:DNA-binding FrmR family transcriptional regulator [Ureibacillus xyleni]|uniref:DNA-binding FrmR family transcriptional regulator n=1 Tax=Ureibacillus xyleni TaxID=614648 RepID=A0A285THE0_9BACL|nr:metal-sensitive transcriptional regulator [Ureibacillus xyleni]SOC21631.1 DNA-binding FrmR family transcriptional regulator [Ureibacillus xyleni]
MNSDDVKIKNRIKRIEGQLRGILKMMDEEKDCKAVVTQLSAVRSGVDHTIGVIVSQNLKECILEAKHNDDTANDSIQEAMDLLVKSR